MFLRRNEDKYTFEGEAQIDCASRIPVCRGVCCRLPFVLSRQDVDEGIIRWDPRQQYWIAQGEDGHCVHQDRTSRFCSVHAQRPVPCRAFDCRNDSRIWLDFENMVPNPAIYTEIWPFGLSDSSDSL